MVVCDLIITMPDYFEEAWIYVWMHFVSITEDQIDGLVVNYCISNTVVLEIP